jgi:hypothetical protein
MQFRLEKHKEGIKTIDSSQGSNKTAHRDESGRGNGEEMEDIHFNNIKSPGSEVFVFVFWWYWAFN